DQGFYLPFGTDILSEIYNFIELIDTPGSLFLKSIFLAFLEQSSYPFFEMLGFWLGLNTRSNININNNDDDNNNDSNYLLLSETLGDQYCDPYDEFFIDVKSCFVQDEKYWETGTQVKL